MKIVSLGPQHLQTEDPVIPRAPTVAGTEKAPGIAAGPSGQQTEESLGQGSRVLHLIDEIRRRRLRKKRLQGSEVSRRYQKLDAFVEEQSQKGIVLDTRV